MWNVNYITRNSETSFAHINLTRLDADGKEVDEKLVLPITLTDKYDADLHPKVFSDGAVIDMLDGIIDTLDYDEDLTPEFQKYKNSLTV